MPTIKYTDAEKRTICHAILAEIHRGGATIAEAADKHGVHQRWFKRARDKFPDIEDSYQAARAENIEVVENALFKRAHGYRYTETKIVEMKNKKTGEVTGIRREVTEKECPPDVTAGIFFLTNRDRDNWKKWAQEPVEQSVGDDEKRVVLPFLPPHLIAKTATKPGGSDVGSDKP